MVNESSKGEPLSEVRQTAAHRGRRSATLRVGITAALAVASLCLACAIISSSMGMLLQSRNAKQALAWAPGNEAAMIELAEQEVRAPSLDSLRNAEARAKSVFVAAPLGSDGLRLLSHVAERKGSVGQARALMVEAARRNKRDVRAQAWLLVDNLKSGQDQAAVENGDAILRVNDSYGPILFPSLIALAARPAGMAALETALVRRPAWRTKFLTVMATSPEGAPSALPILLALKERRSEASEDEITPLLYHMIKAGKSQEAYISWVMLLPDAKAPFLGDIYDGQFSLPTSQSPFDWIISPTQGASLDIDRPPVTHDGRALHVAYDGFSQNLGLIQQSVALSPGRYTVSGYAFTAAPETAGRVTWAMSCYGSQHILARSDASQFVPSQWSRFSYEVDIPAADCGAQTLRLLPQPGERPTSVDIWYDDIAMKPVA